jgi:hypothetical protein
MAFLPAAARLRQGAATFKPSGGNQSRERLWRTSGQDAYPQCRGSAPTLHRAEVAADRREFTKFASLVAKDL